MNDSLMRLLVNFVYNVAIYDAALGGISKPDAKLTRLSAHGGHFSALHVIFNPFSVKVMLLHTLLSILCCTILPTLRFARCAHLLQSSEPIGQSLCTSQIPRGFHYVTKPLQLPRGCLFAPCLTIWNVPSTMEHSLQTARYLQHARRPARLHLHLHLQSIRQCCDDVGSRTRSQPRDCVDIPFLKCCTLHHCGR